MPKTYIAKALSALSKRVGGPELCEKVAKRLSAMPSADVNRVNSALDFGWLKWKMRNVVIVQGQTADEVANLRRAAMLVTKALGLSNELRTKAESWDQNHFRSVFEAGAQAAVENLPGCYLKGSFWGFSNHSEREWTKSAWNEATRLVELGIRTGLSSFFLLEFGQAVKVQGVSGF